ncbi:carboxymuconolactone decarboxylase family protein [Methanolobus bombayensis]|uniref:carboxymuconolactone decarboxylase family protein n=1 Tax=Methanolobus bombayensis TaxID=38023 RepID=UPI001AE48C92|nr:carboxymuconolactone decarboxylase family protein [Methanolobus bombayensis]MBP1909273.1 AhpD family alkylhydroperoxidase [Methanolobus bombayensis]
MNNLEKFDEIDRKIGFSAMKKNIMKDGAIDSRTKKLLVIASAVAVGCDKCFSVNRKLAKEAGISEEEIDEAILVASLIRMGSGLNYTWKIIDE